MQHIGHVAGAVGDHEAEPEGDAGGVDHADHDADGGGGGPDRQRVLHADMEGVEEAADGLAFALARQADDQTGGEDAGQHR